MIENSIFSIPVYKEINEFLISINSDFRTLDRNFFCFRLSAASDIITYKKPFKKDFYYLGLVTNAGDTSITYDGTNVTNLNSFLVFQSPHLLYSFIRDQSASGYLIYFKRDLFSFFKPHFQDEFPMFALMYTNFIKINESKFKELETLFQDVFFAYENDDIEHKIAAFKLLILLYHLKGVNKNFQHVEESFKTPQHILFQKFMQLVNNFYLEKRTIDEYALLLSVSANHLSKSIKSAAGKNALSFINERIIAEAKSMIRYSNLDIAEIAYQIHFSDSSYFGRFFKKYVGISPLEYRKNAAKL
jgi:AraC family transcriptional regulator, transcriptional activator of pobA